MKQIKLGGYYYEKCMFILIVCLTLMSSTCENPKDRHYSITIQNQSDSDVDVCTKSTTLYDGIILCALNLKFILGKHSVFEWSPFNSSIERNLDENSVLELYFVNNRQPQGFYDCDSIFIKNDILKHYTLTLKDLQRCNFTITYP